MYYAHFGLTQAPFTITPNTEFFFSGGNRGAVLEALIYAILNDEGIIKLTGEVGTGKTMLCRMLQAKLPATVETAYLANPNVSAAEIQRAIAHELRIPVADHASRLEITQALHQHLLARHAENKKVVVFVEESQNTPIETLEEIRLLSNLETSQHKLLQIVLFGQPELNENLRKQEIRQLKDRITHSFTLNPLNAKETEAYLRHRLRAAGYRGPDLFPASVIRYITKASAGLSRRINILADKTLLAAFAGNTHTVKLKHARLAVRDIELKLGTATFSRLRIGAVWLLSGIALGVTIYWAYHSLAIVSAPVVMQVAPPASPSLPEPPIEVATTADIKQFANAAPAELERATDVPVDRFESRLEATQKWLARQDAGIHSIQLMGSESKDELKLYLQSLPDLKWDEIYIFPTAANKKPSLTVLYGSFPNRALARGALEDLPPEFKTRKPYLRTVGGIRTELRNRSFR